MVNNCKNLNVILTICTPINTPCRFMADPHSCPSYDEEFMRPHQSHPSWAGDETILPKEEKDTDIEISEKPDRPCGNCGANDWWLRTALGEPEWLCGRCHPQPIEKEVPDWF